ncbi:AAA family ATPase [Halobaculum sp. MBLA0147]|uniref:AAA family ATPase n=1 Tax=Halobaculum sp. MBLA0147 TaxID=3079934 RepID=UPI0035249EE3
MRVLGTVGLPGSGKGEAATVAREADIPVVTMGDVIRDACRDRGLDPAEHHGTVAKRLREEDGPTAIADRTVERLRAVDDDVVLVDGLRAPAELDTFRDAFGDAFTLVAVEAPFEVRAERAADRGRDDSDGDREAFREREDREKSFGLVEVMDRADVTVDNTGSLAAYHSRIRELLGVDDADAGGDRATDEASANGDDPAGGDEGERQGERDDATADTPEAE